MTESVPEVEDLAKTALALVLLDDVALCLDCTDDDLFDKLGGGEDVFLLEKREEKIMQKLKE